MVFPSISFPHDRSSVESLRSWFSVRILGVPENLPLTMLPLISGVGAVLDRVPLDLERVPRLVPETSFGFQILISW